MSRWTAKDLEKLKGRIVGDIKPKKGSVKYKKVSKAKADIGQQLFWWCKEKGIELKTEFVFHPTRMWRFDFCIVSKNIAIEYEGVISEKSRHTTIKGFTEDLNKYNEAQKLGWIVLRYSALNYKNLLTDLNFLYADLK